MAELMTVEELAEYLKVTKKTIYRMINKHNIPAAKIGRQWRFDRKVIDSWLKRSIPQTGAEILVIDDEEIIRLLFAETLSELGHNVTTVGNPVDGLEIISHREFDLLFLDLKMPGMDGAQLFQSIRRIQPRLPVTIITGFPESDIMERALNQGPFGVMNKPFDESDIIAAAENFLRIIPPSNIGG